MWTRYSDVEKKLAARNWLSSVKLIISPLLKSNNLIIFLLEVIWQLGVARSQFFKFYQSEKKKPTAVIQTCVWLWVIGIFEWIVKSTLSYGTKPTWSLKINFLIIIPDHAQACVWAGPYLFSNALIFSSFSWTAWLSFFVSDMSSSRVSTLRNIKRDCCTSTNKRVDWGDKNERHCHAKMKGGCVEDLVASTLPTSPYSRHLSTRNQNGSTERKREKWGVGEYLKTTAFRNGRH